MNKSFLLIGGIIFAIYIYLTIWNIFYSHKKQKENHYPNLTKKDIEESFENIKNDEIKKHHS